MPTYYTIHGRLLAGLLIILLAAACRPSREAANDFIFFEQRLDSLNSIIQHLQEPTIRQNDILSLQISSGSLNQEQANIFNLMNTGGGMGMGGMGMGGIGMMGYLVDYDGTISIPLIGRIPAEGLTKNQLNDTLIARLSPYVQNPVINIRFVNFRVLLMGEVRTPGWQNFPNERATIVDALGQAGGLTDMGLRENILLIRELPGGKREYHSLNINDARIFASPYFQLHQNDIVYVLPNNTRLIQYQRQNSPFFRDLPVYLGLVTSIMAFGTLILALLR